MGANVPGGYTASMFGVEGRTVLRKIGTRHPPTRTHSAVTATDGSGSTGFLSLHSDTNNVISVFTRCTEVSAITSYHTRRNNGMS